MRKCLLLPLFIGVFSLLSCNDDDNETVKETPFNEPTSEVRIYTESEANYVAEDVSENSIVFNANTPADIVPEVGRIIQLPVSDHSPYGFLGRVVSVKKEGNIVVTTENVALDEAYPNLSIDTKFNFLDIIDGVYDENGNPVEYEIVYEDSINTRYSAEIGDGKLGMIKVPIKNEKLGEFTIGGYFSFDFGWGDFSLDNKNGFKYLNIEATPTIDANVQIGATILEPKSPPERRSKRWKFTGRLMPVAGVIVPITVYANTIIGAKGEMTTSTTLQFQKSCHWFVNYQNEKWDKGVEIIESADENPWYITQFDVNGELYAGIECGILIGLYTATSGVGVNLLPKASLSAEASLSSLDPFVVNPEVSIGIKLESSIYCIAELFGKKLAKWELKFPELTFWEKSLPLFPNIENFTAQGGSSSGEISYQNDSYYLLQRLGVKTGARVYESDQTTEFNTYYPALTSIDKLGIRYYNVDVSGLQSGKTYYAAPVISWLNFAWFGDMHEFTTEAGYTVCWRCQGRADIWSLHLDINPSNTNIDMTFDAPTYTGQTKRFLKATYNPTTQNLSGTVETLFYDYPSDRRIDGFSVDLSSDDTGYVTNSKVLDNGACYTQIRFIKNSQTSAAKTRGAKVWDDSEGLEPCEFGEVIQ